MIKYQIIRKAKNAYYFRIVANNGKILAHSETYTRRENVNAAVDKIVNESLSSRLEYLDQYDPTIAKEVLKNAKNKK